MTQNLYYSVKNPLLGVVCLLTTGGLISIRPGCAPVPRLPGPPLVTPSPATTPAPSPLPSASQRRPHGYTPSGALPLPHHSHAHPYLITSSAWKRTVGGMVSPRARAVLRLMTSMNFIGCSTGRSAGFAPLRILS